MTIPVTIRGIRGIVINPTMLLVRAAQAATVTTAATAIGIGAAIGVGAAIVAAVIVGDVIVAAAATAIVNGMCHCTILSSYSVLTLARYMGIHRCVGLALAILTSEICFRTPENVLAPEMCI
jgi:hypothetical protein